MGISSHRMWSPDIYEDPEKFDGYRFLNRRKVPGLEMKSQLVSTSTDHLGFSHGKHACPGRFFAANEVKIAMVCCTPYLDEGPTVLMIATGTLDLEVRYEDQRSKCGAVEVLRCFIVYEPQGEDQCESEEAGD